MGSAELKAQLERARRKASIMETLPAEEFQDDILKAQAHVAALEERMGAAGADDIMSEEPAPGVESGLLGKLSSLLSRHQVNMAAEESAHSASMADMESQVVELRARMAAAAKEFQARSSNNDELLCALQAKVHSLTTMPPKAPLVEKLGQEGKLDTALQRHFKPDWLQKNGLGGITPEGLKVIMHQTLKMLHSMGPLPGVPAHGPTGSACYVPSHWAAYNSKTF